MFVFSVLSLKEEEISLFAFLQGDLAFMSAI